MKLLFVGAEAVPYVSTGGLGDVLGSLPQAVKKADPSADVRVILPLYKKVKDNFESSLKTQWKRGTGIFNQFCRSFISVILANTLYLRIV